MILTEMSSGPLTDFRGTRTVEDWIRVGQQVLVESCHSVHIPTIGANGLQLPDGTMARMLQDYWANMAAEHRQLRRVAPQNYREASSPASEASGEVENITPPGDSDGEKVPTAVLPTATTDPMLTRLMEFVSGNPVDTVSPATPVVHVSAASTSDTPLVNTTQKKRKETASAVTTPAQKKKSYNPPPPIPVVSGTPVCTTQTVSFVAPIDDLRTYIMSVVKESVQGAVQGEVRKALGAATSVPATALPFLNVQGVAPPPLGHLGGRVNQDHHQQSIPVTDRYGLLMVILVNPTP